MISDVQRWVDDYPVIARLGDQDKAAAHAKATTIEAARLQSAVSGGAPVQRWGLAVQQRAQQPIATGVKPLTAQETDAYAELLEFVSEQNSGHSLIATDRRSLDAFASDMAATYPTLTPDTQMDLQTMPRLWSAVRAVWPTLSQQQQRNLVQQLSVLLPPSDETSATETSTDSNQSSPYSAAAQAMTADPAHAAEIGEMVVKTQSEIDDALNSR
jgi:hypothetical protein